uniref:PRKCSH domain-containing protein n=1 Tax=Syphacia muris TaxID=451379 RepID=A0A0N5AW47_9BILA
MLTTTVFLLIMLSFVSFKCSELNTIELQESVYQVNINDVPLGFNDDGIQIIDSKIEQLPENQKTIFMTSQFGQKFICTLPTTSKKEEAELAYKEKNYSKTTIEKIVSAGFYAKKCTKREFAWWTYEVCYGSVIKQYHVEVSGTISSAVSLGFFAKNMDVPSFAPKQDRQLYFEQQYSNGTICDLTGKPRTATVRYYCEQLLETGDSFIYEVDESSTCEYVISIKTGSLCKLPSFLPVGQHQDPMDILCRPWLRGFAAFNYIKKKEEESQRDAISLKACENGKILLTKMELAYREGLSILKQSFSLQRLMIKEPRSAKKANLLKKRLHKRYKNLVKELWRLNENLSNSRKQEGKLFLLDEFFELGESYTGFRDQENAEVYWYFRDPFWDKKYFPPTYAYIRSLNKFYDLADSDNLLADKIGKKRDQYSYALFLKYIDNGIITEADLSNLLGPLSIAFEENRIPTVENTLNLGSDAFKIGTNEDAVFSALQKLVVENRLKPFENRVIESLLNGDHFAPKTVMSKVARDLLSLRNLQERFYKLSNKDSSFVPAPYTAIEEIFKMYQDAYNRAIKRYDYGNYEVNLSGNIVALSNAEVGNKKLKIDDISTKNAYFLYQDELDYELYEVFPTSESGVAWEEKMAQKRMVMRAKRFNLRKLVENYFRKPDSDKSFEDVYDNVLMKQNKEHMKILKILLKTLQKDAILPEDGELTVHLVTADGEAINTNGDESWITNFVKSWLEEQSNINEEIQSHERLIKAYLFGATKEELEAQKQISEPKQTDLPVIRELP